MEQEELKAKHQQEQLKWHEEQATCEDLLQLWQCEPFCCGVPLREAEDNGGKLIRKDKAKSFPNKNNFTKKTPTRGLVVQEEYREDDDDDEDSEAMAMASVAIATTPRMSLFDSPNENITAKCLMDKATNKVTSNIKTDRKSTRLNSSHSDRSRMPSSA